MTTPLHLVPTPADVARKQKRNGEDIVAAVEAIRAAADQILTMSLDGVDAETAVRVNHTLRMARLALGAGEEFAAKHAASVWGGKWATVLTVEGVGTARPYRGDSKVKWDHEDLAKEVVDVYLEQHDGDLSDPYDLLRAITSVASIDYWRVGELEKLGIDADEYRERTRGNVKLRITTNDKVGATTTGGDA